MLRTHCACLANLPKSPTASLGQSHAGSLREQCIQTSASLGSSTKNMCTTAPTHSVASSPIKPIGVDQKVHPVLGASIASSLRSYSCIPFYFLQSKAKQSNLPTGFTANNPFSTGIPVARTRESNPPRASPLACSGTRPLVTTAGDGPVRTASVLWFESRSRWGWGGVGFVIHACDLCTNWLWWGSLLRLLR